MRILHVVDRLDARLGGVPAAIINLARAERESGLDVTIVATREAEGQGNLQAVELEGVPCFLFRRSRVFPYSYSGSLRTWLNRNVHTYDMVEIHGVFAYPAIAGSRAAHRTATPYLLHPHGSLDPFDLRKHRLLKRVIGPLAVRPMLSRASRTIATTDLEGERLERYGSAPTVTVLTLPYRVEEHSADPVEFRRVHGLAGAKIILFLGRINYKKGISYVIDALPAIRSRVSSAVLVLGGDDSSEYARHLRRQVRDQTLTEQVMFLGHLGPHEKSSALAAADLFVLVSDNENQGLVLAEAAWWGLPLVVSSEVYIASRLNDAGAAVVVDRTPQAVAEAVTQLLTDPAMRERMGACARQLAATVFSWEACASAQVELRHELAAM